MYVFYLVHGRQKKTIAIEAIFSEKPVPYVSICVYVVNMIGKELGLKGGAGGDGR